MMLGEPVDSVYGILYHAMRLDTAFVCYQIIDGNNSHKSFGIKNYESLSTSKWKKLYEFCKPYRQELEEEYQILVEADEKKVNPNLLALLKMIMNRDSYYRDELEEAERIYGSSSQIVQGLWKKQQHLDSLNCVLVDSLIDAHNGYIDNKITGEYHKNDLLIIALHSTSVSFLDKHYAMFERLVKENIVSKDLFMILCDRYHLQKHGKQIFGTQRGYNYSDEPNVCRAAPMYPKEKLIELKKELGFKHH